MNKLEKFLGWVFGEKYSENEEIIVEIMHLRSSKRKVDGLQKTITNNWLIYPLKITRPKFGRTKIQHICKHCNKPLVINVVSRNTLKKIINFIGLIACGAALAVIISLIIFGTNSIAAGLLAALLFVMVFLLVIILPMEYKQKGISFGFFRDYPLHKINYSPEEK